ncbi:hypothetical protein KAK06_22055 [Ideonella sp. 4Y11]|uniref:Uncharacterized protein n=1 Tax=Ideonella aquatica TaxID=2824119 RepID=A0A940YK67_9BURK|nr:hypothetical protein [Ideonella aquatica]MBQ0961640.1 hypothetical protein [Ideonella aquatica]
MVYYLLAAVAVLLTTSMVWLRYLRRISGGGLGQALSPTLAGVGLHHVMLSLGALFAVRQLYLATLGLSDSPAALPGALALFAGLAVLCMKSTAALPAKSALAAERT